MYKFVDRIKNNDNNSEEKWPKTNLFSWLLSHPSSQGGAFSNGSKPESPTGIKETRGLLGNPEEF